MKRKITLGLLVFIMGVFIASCGSKKSATNNNTTTNNTADTVSGIPDTFDLNPNNNCGSATCSQNFSGTYEVLNSDLYLNAYGYTNNNNGYGGFNNYQDYNLFNGGTAFDSLLNGLANAVINPALGAVQCGTTIWITEKVLDIFNIGNNSSQNYNCTTTSINNSTTGNSYSNYSLASSYPVDMVWYQENSVITVIDVHIKTNIDSRGGERFRMRRRAGNVYSTDDNRVQMSNHSGVLMFSSGGQAFGRIQR